jgi:hypothetical protein
MSNRDLQGQITIGRSDLDRRKVLLGGTALAAASALSTATSMQPAQAQVASSAQKPNILFIMGDDVG